MKTRILLFIFCAFAFLGNNYAAGFPVTLKIIDESKTTTNATGAEGVNVIVGVDNSLKSQNPRNPNPDDWWYPMYAEPTVTPNGTFTENADDVTWEITLNAEPGDYTWTPFLKSLGWKFLNNVYMYSDNIDAPAISFTVSETGAISSGTTTLTIPLERPKFPVTLKVVDKTAGVLTNSPNFDGINVIAWVGGNISPSPDWWTAFFDFPPYSSNSILTKGETEWTWEATFQAPAGIYEWNPCLLSLGNLSMNGNVPGVLWEGANLIYMVGPDGSVSGDNVLTVTGDVENLYLTLNVDMNDVVVDPAGVFVTGTFNSWNPAATQMADEDGDGIYTVKIPVYTTTAPYEYKFINGNTWGKDEVVFGDCVYRTNRLVWINDEDVEIAAVKFGYCDAEGTPESRIKVGCIGDSNTQQGIFNNINDYVTKTWPMQIRELLGAGYTTENFGVSGATLMNLPEPWGGWTNNVSGCYEFNKLYNPDVILVALGSNDARTETWGQTGRDFKADYISLINEFRAFSSDPEIYMIMPIKSLEDNGFGISNTNIENGVMPQIREISKEQMIPVIDWHAISLYATITELPDGVHANESLLKKMAEQAANIVLMEKPTLAIKGKGTESSTTYFEYRWYLNGQLIAGANTKTYIATQAGTYNAGLKLSENADDIIISQPFEVTGNNTELIIGTPDGTSSVDDVANNNEIILINQSGSLFVKNAAGGKLSIFDLSGKIITNVDIIDSAEQIDISGLAAGIYICKVQKEDTGRTVKIIR